MKRKDEEEEPPLPAHGEGGGRSSESLRQETN